MLNHRILYLAGLPYSGMNLLCRILLDHPEISDVEAQSPLCETLVGVRSRDQAVESQSRRSTPRGSVRRDPGTEKPAAAPTPAVSEPETEAQQSVPSIEVKKVRVYDYEAMKQEYDLW